jgi:hypothetical protein
MRSSDPFCAAELVLARRWERGEITDQQLISAIQAIAVRQVPLQQSAIARELDRQLQEEKER